MNVVMVERMCTEPIEAAACSVWEPTVQMHVQAKGKELETLNNVMKQKDDLMAQKQRQIDSLLAAIGARPASTGVAPCLSLCLSANASAASCVRTCSWLHTCMAMGTPGFTLRMTCGPVSVDWD